MAIRILYRFNNNSCISRGSSVFEFIVSLVSERKILNIEIILKNIFSVFAYHWMGSLPVLDGYKKIVLLQLWQIKVRILGYERTSSGGC